MNPETFNLLIGFLGAALGGGLTSLANWLTYRQADRQDKRRIDFEREKLQLEQGVDQRREQWDRRTASRDQVRDVIAETFEALAEVRTRQMQLEEGTSATVFTPSITRARGALIDWMLTVPSRPEVLDAITERLAHDDIIFSGASHGLVPMLSGAVASLNPVTTEGETSSG